MALVKLLLDVATDVAEEAGQVLIELGAGGVEEQQGERGARLIVYGDDRTKLSALSERARDALAAELGLSEEAGTLSIRLEVDPHSNWDTAWTQHLQPQQLTPRWVIQPVWDETPAPEGLGILRIRPTLAFGDGAHVTTRLAAQAVERFCQVLPGRSVLDVGTGSGVLALIAVLSGAATVLGIDTDAVALSAARENAELNGLLARVSFQDAAAEVPPGFELVVANLEPRALLDEASRLAQRAQRARELVLTGFLNEQAGAVLQRFSELGFSELGRIEDEGWTLLVLGHTA